MNITDIKNQPCEVKNITLRTRGDNRERTAQFLAVFYFSEQILEVMPFGKQKYQLKGLWDEDGNPQPGIAHVQFSREHEDYRLAFARNNAEVMSFHADKMDGWRAEPIAGKQFKVQFRAFGVCSEGDTETLHKMLRDPGLTLTIQGTEQSSGLFD